MEPTKVGDKQAAKYSATATPQPVVDALQNTLCRATQMLWSVVGDVRAAGGPHRSVRDSYMVQCDRLEMLNIENNDTVFLYRGKQLFWSYKRYY